MNFSRGDYNVAVYGHIGPVAGQWDAFYTDVFQLQSQYLTALESAKPSDMQFRYVLIFKGESLVSCAYLQIVEYSEKNFSGKGNTWILPLLKLFFRIKKVRLLFCGNLFSLDYPCLRFHEESIPFEEVIAILKKVNQLEKAQLLMLKEMNVPAEKIRILEESGFRKYGEDLTMKLEIKSTWLTFDDYFKALSKKYRKRLKQIRQSRNELIVRVLAEEEARHFLPRIGELFSNTTARQFLKMGIINERYFEELQKAFGRLFYLTGYFHKGQLIAFSSHIVHPETLEVHYIGIDYNYNEKFALYFNILYDGVETSILTKKRNLELGRTAREAKASVGCKPSPSYDYLFVSNTFTNFLIKIFERLFLDKMGDRWKNRNPFKST